MIKLHGGHSRKLLCGHPGRATLDLEIVRLKQGYFSPSYPQFDRLFRVRTNLLRQVLSFYFFRLCSFSFFLIFVYSRRIGKFKGNSTCGFQIPKKARKLDASIHPGCMVISFDELLIYRRRSLSSGQVGENKRLEFG